MRRKKTLSWQLQLLHPKILLSGESARPDGVVRSAPTVTAMTGTHHTAQTHPALPRDDQTAMTGTPTGQ